MRVHSWVKIWDSNSDSPLIKERRLTVREMDSFIEEIMAQNSKDYFLCFFPFFRERAGMGQRERERKNQKQAPRPVWN